MPRPEPWPGVRFGNLDASTVDWRATRAVTDADPDDEELPETPPDVAAMLGFDPLGDAAKLAKRKGGKSLGPIEQDRKAARDAQASLHVLWRSIFQKQERAARRALLSAKKLAKAFNEDQPRDEHGRFAGGGATQPEAAGWIGPSGERKFPDAAEGGAGKSRWAANPIPQASDEIRGLNLATPRMEVARQPVTHVPVESLRTTQEDVDAKHTKDIADAWKAGAEMPPINVYKYKDELVVGEGNHRAAAAWVLGKPTMAARVLDLDDPANAWMISHKGKFAKQEGDDEDEPDEAEIDAAIDAMDLGLTRGQTDELTGTLEDLADDSGGLALAQVGLGDNAGMFEHMAVRARDWAKDHAAELVANIEETTRDEVKQAVVDGYEENLSVAEIADRIEEIGGFSEDRAALIAQTEVRFANSYGALEGYREAAAGGVEMMKEWLAGPGACEDCQDNEDEGPIALDDTFPSDDDAPPAHPNCRCAISPVVFTAEGESDQEE